jgi:hypothetical protein
MMMIMRFVESIELEGAKPEVLRSECKELSWKLYEQKVTSEMETSLMIQNAKMDTKQLFDVENYTEVVSDCLLLNAWNMCDDVMCECVDYLKLHDLAAWEGVRLCDRLCGYALSHGSSPDSLLLIPERKARHTHQSWNRLCINHGTQDTHVIVKVTHER